MKSKSILLLLATLILFSMVGFRMLYSGSLYSLFLIWNTFLASIPFVLSVFLVKNNLSKIQNGLIITFCILFLPNALYLISDFEHLVERYPVPFFYDILLMFYAALIGLLFNILSIKNLQQIARRYFSVRLSNILISVTIFLSGFGVYLGRYLRWNSWDLFTHPVPLLKDCIHRILQPQVYYYTWAVSLGYAFILGIAYVLFTKSINHEK